MGDEIEPAGEVTPEGGPRPGVPSSPPTPQRSSPDSIVAMMTRFGPFQQTSLVDKATTEQLDRLILQEEESSKRGDDFRIMLLNRGFVLLMSLVVSVSLICWIFVSYQKAEALQQLVTLFIGLGTGGVGGFGAARISAKRPGE